MLYLYTNDIPLVCYTCMLMIYVDNVMLYLYTNGMWNVEIGLYLYKDGIYVQVEIENYDSFYEIYML